MNLVRVGCSGWNYRHWREPFYGSEPARRWLELYAEHFDTVEVNATFYRLPRPPAVARWVEQTPPGFLFAVKASRYLTHIKRLRDLGPGVARFVEAIEPLVGSPKMGPVLWQLPENFRRDDERLAAALERLPPGRHCFEFRHASWFAEDVYALLRERGAALVIGDDPRRPFQTHELTADFTYLRFHHGSRGRNGNYSDAELAQWQRRIAQWRRRVEVFGYFNNDWAMASSRRNFLRYVRWAQAASGARATPAGAEGQASPSARAAQRIPCTQSLSTSGRWSNSGSCPSEQ